MDSKINQLVENLLMNDESCIKGYFSNSQEMKYKVLLGDYIDVAGIVFKHFNDLPKILEDYTRLHPEEFSRNLFMAHLLTYLDSENFSNNELIVVDKKEHRSLQLRSMFDEITGVHNRKYILETLDREHDRSLRSTLSFSIAIMDIDDFKRYNDDYGYYVGDKVLAEVGRLVTNAVRKMDQVGRYGGDEFIILFPETTEDAALVIADRVRREIQQSKFDYGPMRVSIGIACSEGKEYLDEIIAMADKALSRAKQMGKNRVCSSKDDMRKAPRFTVNKPVELYPLDKDGSVPAQLVNISLGGARIQSDEYSPAWDGVKIYSDDFGLGLADAPVAKALRVSPLGGEEYSNEIALKFEGAASDAAVEKILARIIFSERNSAEMA